MKVITAKHKEKIMPNKRCFILLLGILFCSSCADKTKVQEGEGVNLQDKWTKEVSKVIKDPVRAERLIALGVEFEEETQALCVELEKLNRELQDVTRNYDATREEYEQVLGEFTEKKDDVLRQYLDALFAMRQQTSPEEWKDLM